MRSDQQSKTGHERCIKSGGKSRKGVNRSQARWQVATVWGYLTPISDSEKSVRACQAASWLGAV